MNFHKPALKHKYEFNTPYFLMNFDLIVPSAVSISI